MLLYSLGFLDVAFSDLIDVILVAFLMYQIYFLIKGSIASRVFLGYLLVYGFYLIVKALNMELLSTILGQFMEIGVLALVIIFQPEIRRFLIFVGRSTNLQQYPILNRIFQQKSENHNTWELAPVIDAVKKLAASRTGALIAIKKEDSLKRYIESGDSIDAELSKAILLAIFQKNGPLHDGAVIISDGRIKAARCMLPVSESPHISPILGFRHRAAIGLSEHSDAAIIVVSEERGEITLVTEGGRIQRHILVQELQNHLTEYLSQ
ncbi:MULTISPECIES: diadenylate cyclase CdaA [unclassified Siphonobacter]|uniref:diadenylate cyclase CdaA n=1 Tax=unclassified Siphonobacter TaxID=2635712 RepID=UPI000CB04C7F|nr:MULTISPECIES: diadenylate cyclase CdaA [unclassified Siphonobacter]MDQ1086591.1 diadenylate cyclase [Siphonobacter sp. SORGH_AS_1065]MDR6196853.1 diadenylate cyclase [Siphonobacter sp. SORGH_AS_0500]PKK35999.1 TIGR00159 family protein [Siphonobacter sp. SORGH_AS_0500]